MKINKNFLIGFLILILITVLGILSYKYYRKLKQPLAPIVNAIPDDAIAFAEFKNPYELWNSKNLNNEIWSDLQQIKLFKDLQRDLFFINTIINLNDEIKQIISSQKMILSVHPSLSGEWRFLFLCNVNQTLETSDINDFLKEVGLKNIKRIVNENFQYYSITTTSTTYFYSIEQGVFMGSIDSLLLEKSINQLNSGLPISKDVDFQLVNNSSGKKVDANIYINYNNLAIYAAKFMNLNDELNFDFVKKLAKWTEFDLIVKKNQLLFNGYTSTDNSFLEIFKNELAVETKIATVLPEKTIMFTNVNFSGYATYYSNYKEYIKRNGNAVNYDKELNKLNLMVKFNLRDNFIRWMGKSYAWVVVNNEMNDESNTYIVCNISDSQIADSCLNAIALASQINSNSMISNKIMLPSVLKILLGDLCPAYNEVWYETAGDFVIFAKSEASLKTYKELLGNGEILANSKLYADFISTNSNQSNISTYFNFDYAYNFVKQYFKPQFLNAFENNYKVIQHFHQISLQFSNTDNRAFTTFNLEFKPKDSIQQSIQPQPQVVSDGSQTSFQNKLISPVFLVKNTTENENNLLVFDAMNTLYCLDKKGDIKWEYVVDGKLLSKVYEVDFLKNSKNQYLFNTESSVYLIDAKGKVVDNYPVKLPQKATSGLCLIDYEKKKDYRLLIPTSDKKVICFNIKGDKITDFKINALKEVITNPPQHIIFAGKDNIIINDKLGNFSILDRKGNERLKLKSPFYKNPVSKFYYDGRYLLTTDLTNTVRFISNKGDVESKTFKNISGNTQFVYEDFNNDGTKDFIFITQNQLIVLKKDGTEIFKYTFKSNVFPDAKFYESTIRGKLIVILGVDNQIYVFDKKGLLDESIAFKGESFPVISVLNDKKQLNLITTLGNKLLKYTFQ